MAIAVASGGFRPLENEKARPRLLRFRFSGKFDRMSHYSTLGVAPSSTYEEIRAAYRALVVKHHPDKGGDPKIFTAIQEAFDVVGDATKRQAYNTAMSKKPVDSLKESAARLVGEYFAQA